jgi:succinyl-CoA synthetase beta subunit
LKLYEYEAKRILQAYGIPVPKGEVIKDANQARIFAAKLGKATVIKAQILVAGRGKAGGIIFADSAGRTQEAAEKLIGTEIEGESVEKLLLEEKLNIKEELFFGLTIDRLNRCLVALASKAGGVNIEEIAGKHTSSMIRILIEPSLGFCGFHARRIARDLGYSGSQMLALSKILEKLVIIGKDYDTELIEMNPLIETLDGNFIAVDARLIIDDNALPRHPDFQKKRLQDERELKAQEIEALRSGLVYVKLNGKVGVLGNGAGLVMATLDAITLLGENPANFLDLGGGATVQRIEKAMWIVLSDPQVEVLFVNILGGITHCDEVARAIVKVRNQMNKSKPVVIRLVGTREEDGKRILSQAGIPVFDNMEEAAKKAVELTRKVAKWE